MKLMSEVDRDADYRVREVRAVLERRMESLERSIGAGRIVRWAGPVLGGVALFVATLTATRSADAYQLGTVAPSLEAEALVIRDDAGVERGAFRVDGDGGAAFTFQDANGRARLRLEVLSDGSPGVSLLDADGDSHAILGLLADGTTSLVFADAGSVARAVLALTPDGATRLVFSDTGGLTRVAVGVDSSGEPEVSTMGDEPSTDAGNDSEEGDPGSEG
jgi:hypothetical protein